MDSRKIPVFLPLTIKGSKLFIVLSAINLQKTCSDVIFVDVPSNANTAQQAAGRILRIGQERICRFWVLTLDHSYDQCIQANALTGPLSKTFSGVYTLILFPTG